MMKITRFFLIVFISVIFADKGNAQCSCWVNRDATWTVAPFTAGTAPLYRNDDGSTPAIPLGFTYCFFGKHETSCYINNNGDISFGAGITAFTALTLPTAGDTILAPFWADVDTRVAPSGVVYYKLTAHYMIVQWDSVGYYDEHTDKLNSFEVVISDGTAPLIPFGNNTEFCYRTMQWTTGDASGGTNGFGGTPACVGANKGDGVSSLQYGLFGQAGASYTGPTPASPYDGVGWLDNQTFVFNGCSSTVPPSVSGLSPCDTIELCMGDTTRLKVYFFSSKVTLTTHSALMAPIPTGVSITNNWPGNTDSLILQLIGSGANYGYHTVKLYGYDNATPHDTTFASFVLKVDSSATGTLVLRKDTICPGSSTSLRATNNHNEYLWSTGSTKDSIIVTPAVTTTYTVTLGTGVCALHLSKTVVVPTPLNVVIDTVCNGRKAIANLDATPTSGNTTFNYAGATVQSFTVPAGVTTVTVTVVGAKGGGNIGGLGASFAGSCAVTPGHTLSIVVGHAGGQGGGDGGGGGGGSYVWDAANTTTPLAIAGGGGGQYWSGTYAGGNGGIDLVTNTCPVGAGVSGHGADGAGGNGGTGGSTGTGPGAAGAGWLSNGGPVTVPTYTCTGGKDRANAFAAGTGYGGSSNGGYGGGGGGGFDAGAGGGGYNGGGGANDGGDGGDGGGSYLNGTLIGVAGDTGGTVGYVNIAYNSFVVGGVGPYTYVWTPSGGTHDTASGLTTGTYTVTVKDKLGCQATASINMHCPNPLPVELLSFNAVYDNNGNIVKVNWASATETNNAYYTVERSQDGIVFTSVTRVPGAGNSDETKYYGAIDPDILGGVVYYRLKQTDYDGNYTYSEIDAVNEGVPGGDVLIVPNPASLTVNVEYKSASAGEKEVINMYDCTGRPVISDKVVISEEGINNITLDISTFSKGVYLIRVDTPYKTYYKKCIKD